MTKIPGKYSRKRDYKITPLLRKVNRSMLIYKGKYFSPVILRRCTIGLTLGEFAITKRLGKKIHNSAKNEKKRNKLKNKKK